MTLSLNETEAMAKRATRGAGYPWGLAEEAAKATRWLCAHGIDGCAALARLLTAMDGAPRGDHAPRIGPVWTAPAALCPLVTGAALSDRAALLADGPLRLGPTAEPALLLPFAALCARAQGAPVTLTAPGVTAITDGTSLALTGALPPEATEITVSLGGTLQDPAPHQTRARPDPAAWEVLARLAHRTYAPATEASRLSGAGAGLNDND